MCSPTSKCHNYYFTICEVKLAYIIHMIIKIHYYCSLMLADVDRKHETLETFRVTLRGVRQGVSRGVVRGPQAARLVGGHPLNLPRCSDTNSS
jgi:hypothetical protein